LKQKQDYPLFEISQTNAILHPTTTIVCQKGSKSTPTNFIQNFENIFLRPFLQTPCGQNQTKIKFTILNSVWPNFEFNLPLHCSLVPS
jgi:hypothetical protein